METENKTDNFIIRYCKVESVEDDAKGYRLKVRIDYYDKTFSEDPTMETIPYCFPLLPKLIHVYPKVGEMVFVILQQQESTQGDRFFVGPIISQDYYLNFCDEFNAGTLLQGEKAIPPAENPDMNPDNEGSIPDREDVALRGRMNSDVVLLNNELRLRCGFNKYPGVTEENYSLNFNDKDMAYIQMKYFPNANNDKHGEYNSVINLVGDRINLMSYDGTPFPGNVDRRDMITPEKQDELQSTLHNLPYGDDLMDYLRKLITIFTNHVHTWHNNPPCLIGSEIDTLNTDLSKFLSKTIKIN